VNKKVHHQKGDHLGVKRKVIKPTREEIINFIVYNRARK
jgi:hypothetical protein